jgi:hypothetical protein
LIREIIEKGLLEKSNKSDYKMNNKIASLIEAVSISNKQTTEIMNAIESMNQRIDMLEEK